METLEGWFDKGVQRVVLGTAAVEDPDFLQEALRRFGESVVVGIDARDGRVAASGWKRTTEVDAIELIERMKGTWGAAHHLHGHIARRDAIRAEPGVRAPGGVEH